MELKMRLFLLNFVLLVPLLTFAQNEIKDVEFSNTIKIENDEASLSGVGIKKKVWVKTYAIGLYHNESTNNTDKIIRSKKPMGIKIHILQEFIAKTKFKSMIREGFEKSTFNINKVVKTKIDYFLNLMDKDLKSGDACKILYHPDTGIKVYMNDKFKGVINGDKFKQALFSIWLDEQCSDKELKKDLLARTE